VYPVYCISYNTQSAWVSSFPTTIQFVPTAIKDLFDDAIIYFYSHGPILIRRRKNVKLSDLPYRFIENT
jgi:hypothetical protein